MSEIRAGAEQPNDHNRVADAAKSVARAIDKQVDKIPIVPIAHEVVKDRLPVLGTAFEQVEIRGGARPLWDQEKMHLSERYQDARAQIGAKLEKIQDALAGETRDKNIVP